MGFYQAVQWQQKGALGSELHMYGDFLIIGLPFSLNGAGSKFLGA
jgi:hypothetical protein